MATSYGWGSNEPTISPAAQGGDSVHTFATKVKTVVADIMTKLNAEWWNTGGSGGVSITGNAGTATKLATARTIAISGGATGTATSFDGSANISIPVTSLDASYLSGTASVNTTGSAAKLTSARTITLSGGASGSVSFDGSSNVSLSVTSLDASKLSGTASISTTGNAATATTATTALACSGNAATATSASKCTGNAATATTATTATTASSCSGNAATATKLKTARTINGTSFDGSADITLSNVTLSPSGRVNCHIGESWTVPSGGTWLVWAIVITVNNSVSTCSMQVVNGGTTVSASGYSHTCWWGWKFSE